MWLNYLLKGQEEICVALGSPRSKVSSANLWFSFFFHCGFSFKASPFRGCKYIWNLPFFSGEKKKKMVVSSLSRCRRELKTYMCFKSLIKHGTMKHLIFLANLAVWGYKQFLIYIQIQLPPLNCCSLQYFVACYELIFPPTQKTLCAPLKLWPQAGLSHPLPQKRLSSRLILLVHVSPVSPYASFKIVHWQFKPKEKRLLETISEDV